jgi:pyruvate carboxylase subunit B
MKYTANIGDKSYEVEISAGNRVLVDGVPHQANFQAVDGKSLFSLLIDNTSWTLLVDQNRDEYRVLLDGQFILVEVQDERTRKIEKGISKTHIQTSEVQIKAPMPGLVKGVNVHPGQEVVSRQSVVILEAMKMENELRAPRPGVVKEVKTKAGDKVDQGQLLMIIK